VVVHRRPAGDLGGGQDRLEQAGWEVEVIQVQVSRSYPLAGGTALQALNPVWIITGSWTNTGEENPPDPPLRKGGKRKVPFKKGI